MSSVYERLKNLFSAAGLNTDTGSYTEAEIFALSSGINLIKNGIDEIKTRIFFNFAQGDKNLKNYAKMLGINIEHADDILLEELIVQRLSHNFGNVQLITALEEEQYKLSAFHFVKTQDGILVTDIDATNIYHIGRFLQGVAVLGKKFYFEFEGMEFTERDSLCKTFRFWDSLNLPFSCIDTLGSALF